jgi:probable addiction module antidote protein
MDSRKYRTLDEYMEEDFKNHPEQVEGFLETVLEEYEKDPDETALLLALRHIVNAKGGMKILSEKTDIPRESLYRILAAKGNPTIRKFRRIIRAFGYTLSFKPLKTAER